MGRSDGLPGTAGISVEVYRFAPYSAAMHPISCSSRAGVAQWLGIGAVAGAIAAAPAAHAGELRGYGRFTGAHPLAPGTAFDLHVAREDLAVDYDDGTTGGDLRLRRLGLSLHEALSANTRLGIRLGWAGLTQSGRPATEGLSPSGYFGELDFAAAWPRGGRVGLDLGASWRYTVVDDTGPDGDRTELDWLAFELRPALRLSLDRHVALRLGGSATAVDGDERRLDATGTTTGFGADGNAGAFAALDFTYGDGDAVIVRARGGNPAGLYASFEQRY